MIYMNPQRYKNGDIIALGLNLQLIKESLIGI